MRRSYWLIVGLLGALAPSMAFGNNFIVAPGKNVFPVILWQFGAGGRYSPSFTTISPVWFGGLPPAVNFTVIEPSKAHPTGDWKWQYASGPLHGGDVFVAQGEEFQLGSINTEGLRFNARKQWVHAAHCKYDFCAPTAIVKRLPVVVSRYGREALVLSQFPHDIKPSDRYSVFIPRRHPSDPTITGCQMAIRLNSVRKRNGRYVASVSTRTFVDPFQLGDHSRCTKVLPKPKVEIEVGSQLDLGDFGGRFRVESIWPATSHHAAWVVLVPWDVRTSQAPHRAPPTPRS